MDRRTLLRSALGFASLPMVGSFPATPRTAAAGLPTLLPVSAGITAAPPADKVRTAPPTPTATPAPTPNVTALGPYDAAMRAYMARVGAPAAALAVVRDGQLVHHGSYGVFSGSQAPTAVTRWRVASLSKMWTASAVRVLVAQGRLRYDTAVASLLGIPPAGTADPRLARVTVRHLLDHAGGWDPSVSGDPMFQSRDIAKALAVASPPSFEQTAAWVFGRPLDFDPGTRSAYSNFGYGVLGLVIAKAAGLAYDAAVTRLVLAPSGAATMALGRSRERLPAEATYEMRPGSSSAWSVFDPPDWVPWPYGGFALEPMAAHGGWIATALDLARYARALDERRADAVPRPESSPIPTRAGYRYWYAHTGSLPGTYAIVRRDWDGAHFTAACALFNQRTGDGTLDGSISDDLARAREAVTAWPVGDAL